MVEGTWQKFWIKQTCTRSVCLRHNITWEAEDGHGNPGIDECPECKALGLKGAEFMPTS